MLAVSHPRPSTARALHQGVMDQSGTIDPAALNASTGSTITPSLLSQPVPRGTKRSRSPDAHGISKAQDSEGGSSPTPILPTSAIDSLPLSLPPTTSSEGSSSCAADTQGTLADLHTSKRSRPLKSGESPSSSTSMQQMPLAPPVQAVQTPHVRTHSLPHASPSQSSPQRSTPGSAKPPVVKALPTVRDHTTDQLGPDGDEYLPRETDQDGELKVSKDGYPQGGRKYKCRTFRVPNRGEKLFMLATECARVLGYRDSYLLFNKNRSLFKIIANQQEKDNLIHQEILPYSYRSRQIAIVTARSMFRQFGSRLIEGGRRVRDDYWEAKARKQGFTEEDAAGEKRPGAAKAREAAAAEAAQSALTIPQSEIIYNQHGPGYEGPPGIQPVSLAPLPMIHMPQDLRSKDYGMMRPRQEPAGPPWQDRSHPSSQQEVFSQAQGAADFNKVLGQQRAHRENYLQDYWKRPHEQPVTEPQTDGNSNSNSNSNNNNSNNNSNINPVMPPSVQSPQSGMPQLRSDQSQVAHGSNPMMNPPYSSFSNQHNPTQSPVQQTLQRSLPQTQMNQASPGSVNIGAAHRQTPSFNYGQQNQMWAPPPQPQPPQTPMYGQSHHQSPMPPPQMQQQPGMSYGQMPSYGGMNRQLYQPSPSPQHFNMNNNQQPGMPGWNTPGSAGSMPPEWPQRFQ